MRSKELQEYDIKHQTYKIWLKDNSKYHSSNRFHLEETVSAVHCAPATALLLQLKQIRFKIFQDSNVGDVLICNGSLFQALSKVLRNSQSFQKFANNQIRVKKFS
jgi:hypothetical protein